ncbi:hypothetical protein GCM10010988_40200 [Cnuibacter physcomitrellae]|nr:hypothetical protein GCM10010988_40200 [Cnuibacter physcomitrellae]
MAVSAGTETTVCESCHAPIRRAHARFCTSCGAAIDVPDISDLTIPRRVARDLIGDLRQPAPAPAEPSAPVIVVEPEDIDDVVVSPPVQLDADEPASAAEDGLIDVQPLPAAAPQLRVLDLPGRVAPGKELVLRPSGALARRVLPVRPFRRRGPLVAAATVVAGLVLIAAVVWGVTGLLTGPSTTTRPAPAAAAAVPLTGWNAAPAWSWSGAAADVVLSADGSRVGILGAGKATVLDNSGVTVTTETAADSAEFLPVSVGGVPGLVLLDGSTLTSWFGDAAPVQAQLPDGATVILRAGALIAGHEGWATAQLLTLDGLVSYTSPRAGTVPIGVTADDGMVWASSRGEALVGSPVGTVARTIPISAPAQGATLSGWLAASGDTIFTTWSTPAGPAVVATSATSGALQGQAAGTDLVWSQDFAQAASGAVVFDGAAGAVSTPDAGFTATTGFGSGFYGASGTRPAVLEDGTVVVSDQTPPSTPTGLTSAGDLVLAKGDSVTAYPHR